MTINKCNSRIIQWTMVLLVLLSMLVFSTTAMAAGTQNVEVNIETTLSAAIAASLETPTDIGKLTVTGPMTADDFSYLRSSLSGLHTIDLRGATLPLNSDNGQVLPLWAFNSSSNLSNLTTVYLSDAVIELGEGPFADLPALTTVNATGATTPGVYLPNVTKIGRYGFRNCVNIVSANFPNVTMLGSGDINIGAVFYYCSKLVNVSFPRLTAIPRDTFMFCTNLANITETIFPEVLEIGTSAFQGCSNLTSINFPKLSTGASNAFVTCSQLDTAILPGFITTSPAMFPSSSNLTTISLPNATTIVAATFQGCTGLAAIDLPKAKTIKSGAFSSCSALKTITLPEAITVESSAFSSCTNLETVSMPKVTTIVGGLFGACDNLKSIDISGAITIESGAFTTRRKLTTLNLPNATEIGASAFTGCSGLTTLTLPKVTTIGDNAFKECTGFTILTLPETISIGNDAFFGCGQLEIVNAPKVGIVGSAAFQDCSALTNVTMTSATTLGNGAFHGCSSLTTASLPSIQVIGQHVFGNCTSLAHLWLRNIPPTDSNDDMFLDVLMSALNITGPLTVHVPVGTSIPPYQTWIAKHDKLETGWITLDGGVLPKVSGTNQLHGTAGRMSATTVSVALADAYFGESITFTCIIDNQTATANATANGTLAFFFTAAQMNQLAQGTYKIKASAPITGYNLAVDATEVGTLALDRAIDPSPTTYRPKVSGTNQLRGMVGEMDALTVNVTLSNAYFGAAIPFTCTVGDQTATANATINGALTFSFTAKQLNQLALDTYKIMVSAPATGYNLAVMATEVGTLALSPTPVVYEPAISGDNRVTVLPNSQFALGLIAELTDTSPTQAIPLILSVNGESSTQAQTGDGTITLLASFSPSAVGEYPIIASAAATEHTKALAETSIGKLKVLDVSKWMAGKLDGKLPAGAILSQANKNVSIGFLADGATLNATTNTLKMQCKRSLIAYIPYTGTGKVTGILSQVRINPFQPKAAQSVPSKLVLRVSGKVSSSTKIAKFGFSAQSMNLLEPGYYLFSVESKANGKYKGFDPVAVAMIQVLPGDGNTETVEWMMPKTLRVSLNETYQLVTAIPDTAALPKLTVSSTNTSVATITDTGVLTTHKAGSTTITVEDAAGRKLKCKVTVVANGFSRARPLMLKGKAGLYASTKKLSYKGNALEAEVFLYNRTGKAIQGADNLRFELYDRETLIYAVPVNALSFTTPLGNKRYKVLKLTITESMLAGVSGKTFDLGTKRYTAIVRGQSDTTAIVPITYGVPTITQPKAADAQSAGSVTLVSSITAP